MHSAAYACREWACVILIMRCLSEATLDDEHIYGCVDASIIDLHYGRLLSTQS